MCDELDSGFDSFDDVGGSFDDVSVDDLSSTMDDVSVVDDNFDSFEEFEETPELTSDDSIMDVMDDTEVDTDMEAEFFEEDVTQYEDVGDFDSEIIDEDVSVDDVELAEEVPDDVGVEETELAEEVPDDVGVEETELAEEVPDDVGMEETELAEEVPDDVGMEETELAEEVPDDVDMEETELAEEVLDDVGMEETELAEEVPDDVGMEETELAEEVPDDVGMEETELAEEVPDDVGMEETELAEEVPDDVGMEETELAEEVPDDVGMEETELAEVPDDVGMEETELAEEVPDDVGMEETELAEEVPDDVGMEETELAEEVPDDVGMEETELAEEEPGEISETSALDNMTEYMAEHNYGPDDFETYSQDPEWQQLNNELLESDGREPIDYSENTEPSAMDNMTEYMYEHNYGRDDFETYSQDPEWQQLNNDLLEEMGREPIDYSENTEASAMDNMTEYMYEHNYGREDFETYSQDPEWQQLNNDLLEEMGREPIDYSENTEASAMDNMTEYMYEHNYGRDDFETYSQDPEWQQLNNDLLEEMGREPIDYSETGEVSEEALFEDIPESEQSVADIMDRVEVDDTETLEDVLDDTVNKPDSSVEEWMDDVAVSTPEESFEENEVSETSPTIEEIENADVPYDIQHNVEFSEALLEERPELAEMFENGEFFEQGNNEHGFEGTCGETTQANTLNKLLGTNEITENDVLNIAIDKNLCEVDILDPANSGGTSTEQFMQLYDEMNHRVGDKLDVELFDYENALGIDDMASKIENGSVLNIAVDSYELWDQPRDITDTAHYTDHWISVTGVDRSADGDITGFKIVDSGGGESYLDVDKFERCYYGAKDNPVLDPTCIVVSRKGK